MAGYSAFEGMSLADSYVNAALDQAMRDETVAKRWAELGADLPADAERKPQALGNLVRTEIDKWVPLIQAAGVVGN